MTLTEVRALFELRSGRSDLVTSEGADNGADFFIQSGQRTLDRLVGTDKSWARSFKEVAIDDYYAIFKGCRAIKKVWFANSDGRFPLTKVSLEEMREMYSDPPDEVTSGTCLYYCEISLRTYPSDTYVIIDYFLGDKIVDEATKDYEYKGIIFLPPSDETGIIEVFGLFNSTPLLIDASESYWSVNFPEVLLMAALYHLEVSYRNTEGAKDWMRAIVLELDGLEKDTVESEIAEVTQIEG